MEHSQQLLGLIWINYETERAQQLDMIPDHKPPTEDSSPVHYPLLLLLEAAHFCVTVNSLAGKAWVDVCVHHNSASRHKSECISSEKRIFSATLETRQMKQLFDWRGCIRLPSVLYGINRKADCSRGLCYGSVKEENVLKKYQHIHTYACVNRGQLISKLAIQIFIFAELQRFC